MVCHACLLPVLCHCENVLQCLAGACPRLVQSMPDRAQAKGLSSMKPIRRKPRQHQPKQHKPKLSPADQHQTPAVVSGRGADPFEGKPTRFATTTASPIANLQELVRRKSLVKLQTGFIALQRNRARILRRMSRANVNANSRALKVLADLLRKTETKAQGVAAEIAERGTLQPEPVKPKPNRQTRNTKAHSKVRHLVKASETAKSKA